MTLTVPRSTRPLPTPTRAAAPEQDDTGAAIAGVGQAIGQLGDQIVNSDLRHQFNSAQNEFTRELGEARLELEQLDDPAAIDNGWQTRRDEIRNRYLGEEAQLDPRLRNDLGSAFDQLANRHANALGQRAIAARRSREEADWITYSHLITSQAAASDNATKDELLEQAIARVQAMDLEPDEQARRIMGLVGTVDNAQAIRLIGENPRLFLDMEANGEFPGLGPELSARYVTQANNAVAAQEKTAQSEADKAAREAEAAIGKRLGEMADIYAGGGKPVDEAFFDLPAVKEHPDYGRAMAARQLAAEADALLEMTPAELDARITEEQARPLEFKWQADRLALLEETRAKVSDLWAADPIGAARELLGLDIPEVPEDGDIGATTQAISARMQIAEGLRERGYINRLEVFDAAETDQIKARLGIDEDPADRARLAGELTVALARSEDGNDLLAEVAPDPVLRHVGGLVAQGGNGKLAEDILRGQQAIENQTVILPPVKDRIGEGARLIDAVFTQLPAGEAIQAQIRAAADALYAARQRVEGPVNDIDSHVYRQAVHEVLGGTGAYDSRRSFGGIQDVRGIKTILPPNMSAAQAENALSRLGLRSGAMEGLDEETAERLRENDPAGYEAYIGGARDSGLFQEQLVRISRDGAAPQIGGKPVTVEAFNSLNLMWIGNDQYVFFHNTNPPRVIRDENGEEYVFSLTRLARDAGVRR